jgi:hypothetical protein
MTEQDAFKTGFLTRCAEERLTGDALQARIAAAEALVKGASTEALTGALTGGAQMLAAAPLLLATAGGGLAGHVAGTLNQPDLDEEDIKARELAATYKALAARARTNRKFRVYRPER